MANAKTDCPNTIHWPPILYVVVLTVAWGLHRWWPTPPLIPPPYPALLGVPLLVVGLAVGVAALLRFRADDTPFDPTASASTLVTGGIYRFTRNPMYLGALVAFTGLGLWLQNGWLLASMPVLIIALRQLAVVREEAYLERRFGQSYQDYKARVRRWI